VTTDLSEGLHTVVDEIMWHSIRLKVEWKIKDRVLVTRGGNQTPLEFLTMESQNPGEYLSPQELVDLVLAFNSPRMWYICQEPQRERLQAIRNALLAAADWDREEEDGKDIL
jgi:hypothetical protein